MSTNFYDLLGLPFDASTEEIRHAYFEAAKRFHPDTNPDPSSNELFLRIQQAYETLRNPKRRKVYDTEADKITLVAEASVQWSASRSALARLPEEQLFYALAEITCQAGAARKTTARVNLALVIDRSTSMQGGRIEMVRNNVQKIFAALKPDDILSVVAFSDRAEVILPATRIANISQQDARLSGIKTGGGTEIYQGLYAGIEQIRLNRDPNLVRQLILITDGYTYGDDAACVALSEQARAEGITISALGIGHEWNDIFLDQIASLSGGTTAYITSSQDLAAFLENTLRNMNSVYARGVSLNFRTDPQVELRGAFCMAGDLRPLPLESPMMLGNLLYGQTVAVLLEFLVKPLPAGKEQVRLLSGRLQMEVFEPQAGDALLPVTLLASARDRVAMDVPPAKILDMLSRVTLYGMQEKARQAVSDGDVEAASRRLQRLASKLLARGSHTLAQATLDEAENIRSQHRFSKDGDKRIKYGTRSLSMPDSRSLENDDLSRL